MAQSDEDYGTTKKKPVPPPAPKPVAKAPAPAAKTAPKAAAPAPQPNPGMPGLVTPPSNGGGGDSGGGRPSGLAAPRPPSLQPPPRPVSPFQRTLRGAISLARAAQAVQQAPQRFAGGVLANRIGDAQRIAAYVRPTLRAPAPLPVARDDRWTMPVAPPPRPAPQPSEGAERLGNVYAGGTPAPVVPTTLRPSAPVYNPGLMQTATLSLDQMKQLAGQMGGGAAAGGGGGGTPAYGVPAGVDPVWYNQFIAEHGGQTPEEVYRWSDDPLGQALWDKAWGDQFLAGNYRPPTEEDWRNTYGSRYGLYASGANIYGQGGYGGGGYGGGGGGGGGAAVAPNALPQLYNAGFNLAFGTPTETYYTPERGGEKQMQADYYALHDIWQNALQRPVDPGEWERIWRDLLSYKASRSNQAAPLTMADIYGYANRMTQRSPQPPELSYLNLAEV